MGDTRLREAAELAIYAPSIFNTQPWQWTVRADTLELRADRTRQLPVVDPDRRLLTLSCGVALHHAVTALSGTPYEVEFMPAAAEPDLLAVVRITGERQTAGDAASRDAIRKRRTDRRPFLRAPIDQDLVAILTSVCERQGALLHVVRWDHVDVLALAAVRAGALQLSNPDYRAELADWTHRPPWSGDGIPLETVPKAVPRRVPVREFAPLGGAGLTTGPDNDWGALYAILYTATDTVHAWLTAGMSLSALLLAATARGLGSAPISDVTEAATTREQLRRLLPAGGFPQIAVRVGYPPVGEPPWTPRRLPSEVITDA